jgi:hypothetical protein
MTRAEVSTQRRALTLGALCGALATLTLCAVVTLVGQGQWPALGYLARVVATCAVGLVLFAGASWVVRRALAWARGEERR